MRFSSYETVKYVSIRDSRLGALRLVLLLAIAVYVGVFELWAFGGWLASAPVRGAVRFSLRQPTVDNCDPLSDGDDDGDNNHGCHNAFLPLTDLPYCAQHNSGTAKTGADGAAGDDSSHSNSEDNKTAYNGNVHPCQIYEAINAQIVTETSLVVLTRASTVHQTLVCDGSTTSTCPRTYRSDENTTATQTAKFYIAQAEAFTVLIDHAVTASSICTATGSASYGCSAESTRYAGRLYTTNVQLCREHDSYAHPRGSQRPWPSKNNTNNSHGGAVSHCYIAPNRTESTNQDFFSLDVLLRAANVTLDDCSSSGSDTATHSENDGSDSRPCASTYREAGATLVLNIDWGDFERYSGLVEPHYTYRAHVVGNTGYKQEIPFYERYRQRRTLLNAHGIRIAVLLDGNFHQFQSLAFVMTLTTAVGLLAVATTVLDALMLYILPEKERYLRAKYETTGGVELVHDDGDNENGDGNYDDHAHNAADENAPNVDQGLEEPLLPHKEGSGFITSSWG
jgi:ATP P2X receptor